MKANKNHFCEYEVLSEKQNLVVCSICGQEPEVHEKRMQTIFQHRNAESFLVMRI